LRDAHCTGDNKLGQFMEQWRCLMNQMEFIHLVTTAEIGEKGRREECVGNNVRQKEKVTGSTKTENEKQQIKKITKAKEGE
jgi:hypothetical protein